MAKRLGRYSFVRTPNPVYVSTEAEAEEWAEYYSRCPAIGYDTETTGLSKTNARIKFFSLSDGDTRICAPVRLLHFFKDVLEREDIAKRLTNAKFDMHMSYNHGILIGGQLWDTVCMDWLIDENRRGRHGLKQCTADYLGLRMAPFKDVFGAVGAVDKEVQTLIDMHDALEAKDEGAGIDLLVKVGKAHGDESTITALKKLTLSAGRGYSLTAQQLLAIARKEGIAGRTRTRLGYVSDWVALISGEEVSKEDRKDHVDLLQDPDWIMDAHDILITVLRERVTVDSTPLEMLELLVGDYASLDAWGSFTLTDVLAEVLSDIEILPQGGEPQTLLDYYVEVTAPFLRTLWNMERRGITVDLPAIDALRVPMKKDIDLLERDMVRLAGWDVNLRSPKQLRTVFYSQNGSGEWVDPFGQPPKFWTKGGASGVKNPSTSKEVIAGWAERGNPLATVLQEHRVLSKLHDTYLAGLPGFADKQGRIRTDLKAHGTVTGRLSSGDPNLQNIPARGEWGTKIRELFIAGRYGSAPDLCLPSLREVDGPPIHWNTKTAFIVADYAQLEMRIMAHMSRDSGMIETIRDGKDLHSMTAALAGNYDYEEIVAAKKAETPTQGQKELIEVRAGFKAVGFGLLYGIGAVKLGRQLGLPVEEQKSRRTGRIFEKCPEAQALIKQYFDIYPDVKSFIEQTHESCEDNLYVETIRGRFRRLPDILSSERGFAAQARRQSVNSIIQGTAADIVIQAMLSCERSPDLRELGTRMLLQIHDELVFEVPNIPDYVDAAQEVIRDLMEDPIPMDVPVVVSMDCAPSWGEAK